MDDERQRRLHVLAGVAAVALLLALLAASFLVARWTGSTVGLEEGLALVESAEPEQRLLGLAMLADDPRAAPVFARALDDPDARVRLTAALMLAGVAGLAPPPRGPDGGEAEAEDFIARMKRWWELEGAARYGGG
jgi:hypothetical protein